MRPRDENPFRLGELLVRAHVIDPAQLSEALSRQSHSGKRLGALLLESGAISERVLVAALSEQLDIPIVDLSRRLPTPDAVSMLPERLARQNMSIPVEAGEWGVMIAVSDPSFDLAKLLANVMGAATRLVIAPQSDIQRAIDNAYAVDSDRWVKTARNSKPEPLLLTRIDSPGIPADTGVLIAVVEEDAVLLADLMDRLSAYTRIACASLQELHASHFDQSAVIVAVLGPSQSEGGTLDFFGQLARAHPGLGGVLIVDSTSAKVLRWALRAGVDDAISINYLDQELVAVVQAVSVQLISER